MLILASADLHGDLNIYEWLVDVSKSYGPDVILLAGDLLNGVAGFGSIEESQRANAYEILEILDRVSQPVFYLMGNDDMVELEPNKDSIRSIHSSRLELGGLNFVGYQYSLPFMGGIFEKPEDGIKDDLSSIEKLVDDRTVLVTHSPAYGILDLGILDRHAGSVSIKQLIERRNPLLHIHGHIHREFGNQGRHYNVAAGGHMRALLIDTVSMKHKVAGP